MTEEQPGGLPIDPEQINSILSNPENLTKAMGFMNDFQNVIQLLPVMNARLEAIDNKLNMLIAALKK